MKFFEALSAQVERESQKLDALSAKGRASPAKLAQLRAEIDSLRKKADRYRELERVPTRSSAAPKSAKALDTSHDAILRRRAKFLRRTVSRHDYEKSLREATQQTNKRKNKPSKKGRLQPVVRDEREGKSGLSGVWRSFAVFGVGKSVRG